MLVPFNILPFRNYAPMQSCFPLVEGVEQISFCQLFQDIWRFLLYCIHWLKTGSFKHRFQFRKKKKVTRCQVWLIWRMFQHSNVFVGQKLLHRKCCVRRSIVLMKNETIFPQFWPFFLTLSLSLSKHLKRFRLCFVQFYQKFQICTLLNFKT